MGILTGFSVKAAMSSEYSATVNFAGETPATRRWNPITANLQALAGDNEMAGASDAHAFGNTRHVFGIVTSVSNDKSVSSVVSSCNVNSFASRLNKFGIIDAFPTPTSIKTILTSFMADNATAPDEIYDFSNMSDSPTFTGIIRGDNILEEMAKLAQAAGADLFVNERGLLVCETWKDQNSAVDVVIPESFLISISREQNIEPQISQVIVRGQFITKEGVQDISPSVDPSTDGCQGGCFVPGTQVLLANNTVKSIEKIEVGDFVKSFTYNGDIVISRVSDVFCVTANTLFKISAGTQSVMVSGEHPFYTGDGEFVIAKKLNKGDAIYILIDDNIRCEKIENIEIIDDVNQDVFNLTAEEHATFFANGFAVHNKNNTTSKVGGTTKTITASTPAESVIKLEKKVNMSGNAAASAQLTPSYREFGSPLTRKQKAEGVERVSPRSRMTGSIIYGVVKTNATKTFVLAGNIKFTGEAKPNQEHNGRRIGLKIALGGSLSVSVRGQTITVTAVKDSTTGTDVINAVNADSAATKLVTLSATGGTNLSSTISVASGIQRLDDFKTIGASNNTVKASVNLFAALSQPYSPSSDPPSKIMSQMKDIDNKITRLNYLSYTDQKSEPVKNSRGGPVSKANYSKSKPPNSGESLFGSSSSPNQLASDSSSDRIEQRVTNAALVSDFGVITEEIDNEYLNSNSQCHSTGVRFLQEQLMNRNQFSVSMIYSPEVKLNSVVRINYKDQIQFLSADEYTLEILSGDSFTGRVVEMDINYDTSPSATMNLTVQSFTDVTSTRYASNNLLAMPQLQSVDGVSWQTKFTKAERASFSGSCVITTSAISATGIGDTGFIAGQWILIQGASDIRNNAVVQILSVSSNSLTIRSFDTLYAETATLTITNSCVEGDEFVKARILGGIAKFGDDAYIEQTVPTPAGTTYKLRVTYAFPGTGGSLTISAINSSGTTLASVTKTSGSEALELSFDANTSTTTIKFEVSSATDDTLITFRNPKLIAISAA